MADQMRFDLLVVYDNGEEQKAHVGQRELAAWEAEPFGSSTVNVMDAKPMMFLRYCAWAYLKRTDNLRKGFQAWTEGVEEVSPLDDEGDEGLSVDPTSKGRPGGD